MTDKTTVEKKDGYLVITGEGVRNRFDAIVAGTIKIREAANEHHMKYVIADYRKVSFQVPMSDAFNLVKTYENEIPEFTEITICAVTNDANLEMGRFWESICNKRGYKYRVFLDFNKAERWIKELISNENIDK